MIYYSSDHKLHHPVSEFSGRDVLPYPEIPERVENIMIKCRESNIEVSTPEKFNPSWITKIHGKKYFEFIQSIPDNLNPIAALTFNIGGIQNDEGSFVSKLGEYFYDPGTPVMGGTSTAAIASVNCALSVAQKLNKGAERSAALCRPPGHHAMKNRGGGYCIFNNIAIAAQYLCDQGKSVSILDLDYHHGNGTQQLFYHRNDVLYVSIHADTTNNYPFYWGQPNEKGIGDGIGFNHNLPVANTISTDQYFEQIQKALMIIEDYHPDTVLVSMGFDTHFEDPIAGLSLNNEHYTVIGRYLNSFNQLGIILEGGYALDHIGDCFVNLYTQILQ